MPSRDYLIRQFEEMGYFLASVLRRILKMKEENQQEQVESAVREELIQELKLDIEQIVAFENEEFCSLIQTTFNSDDQLEKLADILMLLGQEIRHSFTLSKANYIRKSLFLFEYLQDSSTNFSYERKVKIEELRELIRIQGI
jgi:ethanolamine utilization protein EutA (predicted chaperonin)